MFFMCMMLVGETTRRQVGPWKEHIMTMKRLQEKGGEPGASDSKVRLSSPPRSLGGFDEGGGVTMAGRGGDGEIVP
jgi:hypothetical protein